GDFQFFKEWKQVKEVFAYKDDVFAYDIICLGFRTDDKGTFFWIDEEHDGYRDFEENLPEYFPGIRTDWFREVAFPAFATNVTHLWGTPLIEKLWSED
ncbi:MAG: hypothetical protein AAGA58_17145, partial [Verrucomicrobiota bacterium]